MQGAIQVLCFFLLKTEYRLALLKLTLLVDFCVPSILIHSHRVSNIDTLNDKNVMVSGT